MLKTFGAILFGGVMHYWKLMEGKERKLLILGKYSGEKLYWKCIGVYHRIGIHAKQKVWIKKKKIVDKLFEDATLFKKMFCSFHV